MQYSLNFDRYREHFVAVTLNFVAPENNPILWLPTWIAGSYLIREFAKNITNVVTSINSKTADSDNQNKNPQSENAQNKHTQRCKKLSKNQWQVHAKQGDTISVNYEVFCHDLSVRTAYIDSERIFGNFSSLLIQVKQQEQRPCTIDFCLPIAFEHRLAIGLPFDTTSDKTHRWYHFHHLPNGDALTSFESFDYPFELAKQDQMDFEVSLTNQNGDQQSISHRFFISGVHHSDLARLTSDVKIICQGYMDWLGWSPFWQYTFMTYASKNHYGGLEHINSTALITPRDNLPTANESPTPSENYQNFLALCSHEYFHAWWVKSVRPDVMMTSQLQEEGYTTLLWVFEGFTSYLDDFMLYKTGLIDKDAYLNLLSKQITRYLTTEGRHHQSLAESSFDAWIKLYRPDENSPNSTVSYYNKGALVALGLDLLLINYGYRLFDVVAKFVDFAKTAKNSRFGMTIANLNEVMVQFLPSKVWQKFVQDFVDDTKELPLDDWLQTVGITLNRQTTTKPLGLTTETTELGLVIKQLTKNSCAKTAGLAVGDVIIAIDGLKADNDGLNRLIAEQTVRLHIFRQDVLLCFEVLCQPDYSVKKTTLTGDGQGWLTF